MLKISQKTTLILLANFFAATCVHAQTPPPNPNDTHTEICEDIPAVTQPDGNGGVTVVEEAYTRCKQVPVQSAGEKLFLTQWALPQAAQTQLLKC